MARSFAELQRDVYGEKQAEANQTAWSDPNRYRAQQEAGRQEVVAQRAEAKQGDREQKDWTLQYDTGKEALKQSKEQWALEQGQSTESWELQKQYAKEAWDLQKAQAESSGKLASQFLEQWGTSLNQVSSMYGDASKVLEGLMGDADAAGVGEAPSVDLSGINKISGLMQEEYQGYKEMYAPAEQQLLAGATSASKIKGGILQDLASGGGKWTDTEGAASRAATDIKIQAGIQNQAQARQMMSMGIDPSSGRFGALTRRNAIDTAGQTAMAMNQARQAEKNQGYQRGLALYGAINPTEGADTAMAMRSGATDILKGAGAMEEAGANLQTQGLNAKSDWLNSRTNWLNSRTNLGKAYADMASGMAQNVTGSLGEMAGYYTGLSGGAITQPTFNPYKAAA